MSASILKVSRLSHRYSDKWAIRDIDFEVFEPGIIGLLGSNGAGKSTFMNIVCGCLSQTSGSVSVDGIDGRRQPLELRRRIGFLPQQAPLSLELTIEEYLCFCAEFRGLGGKAAAEAVEVVMERCGLTSMRRRLISNLSGGYRQRTGIAQAVVHSPQLVVLDEPTVGLDPNQLLAVRDLILDIGKAHTVLFSSHILSEVEAMCRDVLMIEHGNIVFNGRIDEFRDVVQPSTVIIVFYQPPVFSEIESAVAEIGCLEQISPSKFRVHHSAGREVSSHLLAISHKNGWSIQELHFEKYSLEQVFSALSEGPKS